MRTPKLSTIAIAGISAIIFPMVGLLAVAKASHWSFNFTNCLPIGFYQRGPKPAVLEDGDMVYLCPPVRDHLPLHFVGPKTLLNSAPKGENPAMNQAISGFWLERTPDGLWACRDDLVPFAKEVVATAGQTVQITKKGVIANGKLLPNSQIITKVSGIPVIHLPIGTKFTTPKGYFWDYAPGTAAYTSAYYGPVPTKNILGSLKPALVIPGSQYWYTDKIQKA